SAGGNDFALVLGLRLARRSDRCSLLGVQRRRELLLDRRRLLATGLDVPFGRQPRLGSKTLLWARWRGTDVVLAPPGIPRCPVWRLGRNGPDPYCGADARSPLQGRKLRPTELPAPGPPPTDRRSTPG